MPALLDLIRPHQWLKNGFVLAGLVFSQRWGDPELLRAVLMAFAAFCFTASVVYIVNDWRDRAQDAQHPTKRRRPLASGTVAPRQAVAVGALLAALAVAAAWDNAALQVLLALYVISNLGYSWGLKHVPVVDVFIIASGFMLRLLAGTAAVGIPPSRWLLLTGLFVALFLGFAKRRAETQHDEASRRAVMKHYPPALLDTFVASTMTAAVLTYGLFATSPESLLQHGERLVYTVPVVAFGMLRYTYRVHLGHGEDVSRDLLRDPWILGALTVWLAVFLV